MKVLFVSSEVSPFAKVGGLADVAGSLPKELRRQGHDIRIVMPFYGMIEQDRRSGKRWGIEPLADSMPVAMNGHWLEHATVMQADFESVPVYFIGHERFFRGATSSDKIYTPGIDQYLFFSAAVLELVHVLGWTPDVVQCNDWQTGFVSVLMREKLESRFGRTGAVFTIHNLAYQGEFGVEILDALALPRTLFVPELLETWGAVNFLKAGCVYSDQVNTVSPRYAREIQTAEYGCKLEGLMKHLAAEEKLSGILNGIDTGFFDPANDPYLPAHYTSGNLAGKRECRKALLAETGMKPIPGAPVMGAVTRLSSQKGLDLLARTAPRLFELPIQLVIQGLGDPAIVTQMRLLQEEFPNHIRFIDRFDEDLAQRIYAGSDLFAMPSVFEPCGLGQMIAMRYGTIPVVRNTGGLADTVREGENGFVFEEKSEVALCAAVERAAKAYRKPQTWRRIVRRAMDADNSWSRSAHEYVDLYERALAARRDSMLKLA
ncbi:MAG: glycogen synthase [Fimbriimonadales bacterium]